MKTRTTLIFVLLLSAFSLALGAEDVHILQKNETLYSIAKKYGLSVDDLIRINGIEDVRKLSVGMEIVVREGAGRVHTVEKGETLFGISRKYDISLDRLLQANNLDRSYVLKIGDFLRIPGAVSEEYVQEVVQETVPEKNEKKDGTEEKEIFEVKREFSEKEWPIIGVPVPTEGKLSGVYIKGSTGDPVRTISSGTVVWVGPYRGFGKVVLIQSFDRYVYVYGGNSEIEVEVGQEVSPGMVISKLGINPHSQEPELFFSVFRNGRPVDPEEAPRS